MRAYGKGFLLILVFLFLVSFGLQNSQSAQIKYYLSSLTINLPLYGMVYASIIIGIVIGMAIGILSRFNLRKTIKNLEMENRELKQRVREEVEEEEADREDLA